MCEFLKNSDDPLKTLPLSNITKVYRIILRLECILRFMNILEKLY